jgi:hypothetical protein
MATAVHNVYTCCINGWHGGASTCAACRRVLRVVLRYHAARLRCCCCCCLALQFIHVNATARALLLLVAHMTVQLLATLMKLLQ